MRGFLATLASVGALLVCATGVSAAQSTAPSGGAGPPSGAATQATAAAQRSVTRALKSGLRAAGPLSGAYVADLTTGQTLFSASARTGRLPASVEKLYTTSTALLRFGPNATLTTSILGRGTLSPSGTWNGTLYIRGGGDPTFGSQGFDQSNYGGGATIQRLVANLLHATGIRAVRGNVVGDESKFDSLRGTPATGYQASGFVEGELSAIAYDKGFSDLNGTSFALHPALTAAANLIATLRDAGVNVPKGTHISAGVTPASAKLLSDVHSPRMATLIALTNTPSDNFFAEMLLKDLGAQFGAGGTTADGAAVVRAQLAHSFGIYPQLDDGSGLSYDDLTTPIQVVTLLAHMATNADFVDSLAVAGETGTLQDEMNGTIAAGRCRGKPGTLSAVSNLVGYCQARDGHTLAFAFLMNSIDPDVAHPIQDGMAVALANYDG
jgi:serine-type D-Ala-D-Ala carboxypeptidase/endopeptidase (penicillin-binding protein 4)